MVPGSSQETNSDSNHLEYTQPTGSASNPSMFKSVLVQPAPHAEREGFVRAAGFDLKKVSNLKKVP